MGTVKKNNKYRREILNAVKSNRLHPINNGIIMQAHHVISEHSVTLSGLGRTLANRGWDINRLENLVLLPSTLKGACHLNIQVHRGNHTAKISDDQDGDHGRTYHGAIGLKLMALSRSFKKCGVNEATTKKRIEKDLMKLSFLLLISIQRNKLPLTSITSNFDPDNQRGCCNQDSVSAVTINSPPCRFQRNHFGQSHRQSKNSKSETINFPKTFWLLRLGQ